MNCKTHSKLAATTRWALLAGLMAAALLICLPCVSRAAEKGDASAELDALVAKIKAKLHAGKTNEADFADNLKEFDALLAEHKDEKTDAVAHILLMKAQLYKEVFDKPDQAAVLTRQLQSDFPDTDLAKMMKAREAGEKVRATLAPGAQFPDFNEKDLAGKSLSVANYKGKVVLVDFWATWCGPCVGELPNVIKTYGKHHSEGFEIIGISLDQDEQKLKNFIKQKNMTWQQYFDGKGWGNKLAAKYAVESIPATYLLDGQGKIIGKDLRGEALEEAVAKALTSKS
jgi:peroxiredoxin